MEEQQQKTRRLPTSAIAAIIAALLVGGGGAAWLLSNNKTTQTTNNQISAPITPTQTPVQIPVTPPPSAVKPTETPKTAQPTAQQTAKVYWLKDSGTSTELVPVPVASTTKTEKPGDSLQTAFNTLLTTPPAGTFSSIPQGTKLNSVSIKNDGIHVDLSPEFKTGGGSATMIARLAQVLYTATSSDPNAQVWLSVDGKPLEVLGGEGLVIPVPLTRQTFEKDFSL